MKIAGPITIMAIGIILVFALSETTVGPVNIPMVGWILVAGGALTLIISTLVSRPRKLNRTSESRVIDDPATGEKIKRTDVRED